MKPTLSLLVGAAVLLAAGAASFAAAATLSVSSQTLGAGRAAVPVCDANGFAYTHRLDASRNVATVTVSGIDPSCAGATLRLSLVGALSAEIGSGSATLPASGFAGWVTVTITGAPSPGNVNLYRVGIS